MSAFSEAALERKLSELSNSQQSVQTLSLWLIHHRKHSALIVSVWERELRKGEPDTAAATLLGLSPPLATGCGLPRGQRVWAGMRRLRREEATLECAAAEAGLLGLSSRGGGRAGTPR